MELIIKPTARCNFDCTFCSAHHMKIQHPVDGRVPEKIKQLILDMKPTGIIVTGGEPLMVLPTYYMELYEIAQVPIAVTTNLKAFYMQPDLWTHVLAQDWFNVTTSFNYGDTRQWEPGKPYSEATFVDVVRKYQDVTGRSIQSFIAIIDESNENMVMDHVRLAKFLDCRVRLNNVLGVGRQKTTYPKYKMLKHYIDIIDAGLGDYECNCKERFDAKCPHNVKFMCDSCIRSCYVDINGILHVSVCDEQLTLKHDLIPEDYIMDPKPVLPDYDEFIKPECAYCEMFGMCLGCKTQLDLGRNDPAYCEEMKKLLPDLQRQGWLL